MTPTTPPRRLLVDVVRPGRALVLDSRGAFGGQIVRDGQDYVVENDHGVVIGRARSYRAGAERLARHYGHTPGPIEIDHEYRRAR